MSLVDKHITIDKLISYFLIFDLLTREEADLVRKTGQFPKDIFIRLRISEQISKN